MAHVFSRSRVHLLAQCRGRIARRFCVPALGFADLVCPELVQSLQEMGCHSPNEMQAKALPVGIAGEDLLVNAQTGAGKTLVLLLPLVQRLFRPQTAPASPGVATPDALVIVPTPELVVQVATVAEALTSALPERVSIGRVIGPTTSPSSVASARLLVTTPEEAVRRRREGTLSISALAAVAIDEADSILCGELHGSDEPPPLEVELAPSDDDGDGSHGSDQPSHRLTPQFLLVTATLSEAHEARLMQRFPRARRVSQAGELVPTLRQRFHYFRGCKEAELVRVLRRALDDPWMSQGSTLIFAAGTVEASRVHALLCTELPALDAALLHEELAADERAAAVCAFREREAGALVATQLAARGLDFPYLRHVVLHALTLDVNNFVHCAGRTARRGHAGIVTCLVETDTAGLYSHRSHHALRPAPKLSFAQESQKLRPSD